MEIPEELQEAAELILHESFVRTGPNGVETFVDGEWVPLAGQRTLRLK